MVFSSPYLVSFSLGPTLSFVFVFFGGGWTEAGRHGGLGTVLTAYGRGKVNLVNGAGKGIAAERSRADGGADGGTKGDKISLSNK